MKAGEITLQGKVIKKTFGKGSKSEHEAVYIDTGEQVYKLKRAGGNPFFDQALEDLVGKQITATGRLDDYLFVIKEMKVE
jgi:hypothetical protein